MDFLNENLYNLGYTADRSAPHHPATMFVPATDVDRLRPPLSRAVTLTSGATSLSLPPHTHSLSLALALVLHSRRSHPVVPPPSLPARPFTTYGLRMRLLSIVMIAVSTTRIYIASPSLILLTGPCTLVPIPTSCQTPFLSRSAPPLLARSLPPLLYIYTYP